MSRKSFRKRSRSRQWRRRREDKRPRVPRGPRGSKSAKGPKKFVYFFGNGKADGNRTMKDTLGGKGAGLAEMTNAGLPVPAGFTISTDACNLYYANRQQAAAGHRDRDCRAAAQAREGRRRRRSAPTKKPLLVSVRSGAKFSMPGMMDTILNLGLNDETVEGLKARTGNGRFAFDSYRRFIQMFGSVVLEIPKAAFEHEFEAREEGEERDARYRSRRSALREVVVALQEGRQGAHQEGVPAGPDRAAARRAQRRVPLVEQPARQGIPPHLRHPGLDRHRRQRADDGVRQHRRSLGHRRRLHAQPRDRRQGVLRRVPDQRAGRGRRRRHPHAAADRRAREGDAEGLQAAARHHHAAREQLQGHPGLRVHDPGRDALHAADAQRQAHRLCRGRDRHRPGEGEADHAEGSGAAGRSRSAVAAAGARLRSEGMEVARDGHRGPAGVARRRLRQGGVLGRDAVEWSNQRRAGDPGPARDRAGRHSRHVGVAGHPHRDRRHDLARRGGRPPDGQAVDRRRRRAAHRRARQDASP